MVLSFISNVVIADLEAIRLFADSPIGNMKYFSSVKLKVITTK